MLMNDQRSANNKGSSRTCQVSQQPHEWLAFDPPLDLFASFDLSLVTKYSNKAHLSFTSIMATSSKPILICSSPPPSPTILLKRSASPVVEPAKKRVKTRERSRLWDIEFEDERDLDLRLSEESTTLVDEELAAVRFGTDVARTASTAKVKELALAEHTHPRSPPVPVNTTNDLADEGRPSPADDIDTECFEAMAVALEEEVAARAEDAP